MPHTVLYTQRYLYPCQLSTTYHNSRGNLNNDLKQSSFAFYSPLESHMSIYDVDRDQYEMIDLEGRRFMSMDNGQYGEGQFEGSVILGNEEEIMVVGGAEVEPKIIARQSAGRGEEIISNALIIRAQSSTFQSHPRLIYFTRSQTTGLTELCLSPITTFNYFPEYQQESYVQQYYQETVKISSSKSIDNRIGSGDSITNPQDRGKSYKSIYSEDEGFAVTSLKCIYNESCSPTDHTQWVEKQYPLTITIQQSTRIQLSCMSSQHDYQSTFRLYQQQQYHSQGTSYSQLQLLILNKQQSIINVIDLQYGVVTNTILCCGDYDSQNININPHVLHSQGRKLAILSDNILLQYDSMGVVKIVDKRVGKVVQIRSLSEELAGLRNDIIGQYSFQQRFVKFWNSQHKHTQHYNFSHLTQFMINFYNKILTIDLRYKLNSLNDFQLFSADTDQVLGNYHIRKEKDTNIIGFTTENQHSFKSYVVKEQM